MPAATSVVRTIGLISAAVGASFANAAHAGPISTAPVGFTPVTLAGATNPAIYDIDLDGDGQTDLRFTGGLLKDVIGQQDATLSAPNNSAVFPLININSVQAFASTEDFIDISGIGGGSNFGTLENLTPETPYAEIGLVQNSSVSEIGYIKGIAADGSFTLQDYGLIEVPEPASLSLLAIGAAGIAAFRRRRAISPSI